MDIQPASVQNAIILKYCILKGEKDIQAPHVCAGPFIAHIPSFY